jgi:tripartite-type tricarboxylate transporter receptor subunit TctC
MSISIPRVAATAMLCILVSGYALAQKKPLLPDGFPSKPIRVIVTTGSGGGLDIITRAVANKFFERTGANIVVVNQSGASGGIAINQQGTATADG